MVSGGSSTTPNLPSRGSIRAGVSRRNGGLAEQENRQVAASVTLACPTGTLAVAWKLYLPKVSFDAQGISPVLRMSGEGPR